MNWSESTAKIEFFRPQNGPCAAFKSDHALAAGSGRTRAATFSGPKISRTQSCRGDGHDLRAGEVQPQAVDGGKGQDGVADPVGDADDDLHGGSRRHSCRISVSAFSSGLDSAGAAAAFLPRRFGLLAASLRILSSFPRTGELLFAVIVDIESVALELDGRRRYELFQRTAAMGAFLARRVRKLLQLFVALIAIWHSILIDRHG